MDKKSILEKLLTLANDKCNAFESERAYLKYLELKSRYTEEVAVSKANEEAEKEWNAYDSSTWSEEEREEYTYWRGGKFKSDRVEKFLNEVYKVEGGYLIRRWNYLNAMSFHFRRQLNEFGYEFDGVRKNCLKQITLFEQLQEDEFGKDKYDKHDQSWYTDSSGKFTLRLFQGQDSKKVGNPKINYLMFVENAALEVLKDYWPYSAFENAKIYKTVPVRIESK